MPISVEVRIMPFGELRIEICRPVAPAGLPPEAEALSPVHYSEPKETALRMYEIWYGEEPACYVVPLSTA